MKKFNFNDYIIFKLWRNVAFILKSYYKEMQNLKNKDWYEIPYWLIGNEMLKSDNHSFRTYFTDKSIIIYMKHW